MDTKNNDVTPADGDLNKNIRELHKVHEPYFTRLTPLELMAMKVDKLWPVQRGDKFDYELAMVGDDKKEKKYVSIKKLIDEGYVNRKPMEIDSPWKGDQIEFESSEVIAAKGYVAIKRTEANGVFKYKLIKETDGTFDTMDCEELRACGLAHYAEERNAPEEKKIKCLPWAEHPIEFEPLDKILKNGYVEIKQIRISSAQKYFIIRADGVGLTKDYKWLVNEGLAHFTEKREDTSKPTLPKTTGVGSAKTNKNPKINSAEKPFIDIQNTDNSPQSKPEVVQATATGDANPPANTAKRRGSFYDGEYEEWSNGVRKLDGGNELPVKATTEKAPDKPKAEPTEKETTETKSTEKKTASKETKAKSKPADVDSGASDTNAVEIAVKAPKTGASETEQTEKAPTGAESVKKSPVRHTPPKPLQSDKKPPKKEADLAFKFYSVLKNEDADPFLYSDEDGGLLVVADGLGGSGSYVHPLNFEDKRKLSQEELIKYVLDEYNKKKHSDPDFADYLEKWLAPMVDDKEDTSALWASRVVISRFIFALREESAKFDDLTDATTRKELVKFIRKGLDKTASQYKLKTPQSYLLLPTTLAAIKYKVGDDDIFDDKKIDGDTAVKNKSDGKKVTCDVVWAGDSRCYVLKPDGMKLLSKDDEDSSKAITNLFYVQQPNEKIINTKLNHKRFTFDTPIILMAVSDGVFDPYEPHDNLGVEAVMLETIKNSQSDTDGASIEKLKNSLEEHFDKIKADDTTVAFVALGFKDYKDMVSKFAKRRTEVLKKDKKYRENINGLEIFGKPKEEFDKYVRERTLTKIETVASKFVEVYANTYDKPESPDKPKQYDFAFTDGIKGVIDGVVKNQKGAFDGRIKQKKENAAQDIKAYILSNAEKVEKDILKDKIEFADKKQQKPFEALKDTAQKYIALRNAVEALESTTQKYVDSEGKVKGINQRILDASLAGDAALKKIFDIQKANETEVADIETIWGGEKSGSSPKPIGVGKKKFVQLSLPQKTEAFEANLTQTLETCKTELNELKAAHKALNAAKTDLPGAEEERNAAKAAFEKAVEVFSDIKGAKKEPNAGKISGAENEPNKAKAAFEKAIEVFSDIKGAKKEPNKAEAEFAKAVEVFSDIKGAKKERDTAKVAFESAVTGFMALPILEDKTYDKLFKKPFSATYKLGELSAVFKLAEDGNAIDECGRALIDAFKSDGKYVEKLIEALATNYSKTSSVIDNSGYNAARMREFREYYKQRLDESDTVNQFKKELDEFESAYEELIND
ncbi:MAG: SpoIIE family protein phosphatase [Clostridiaceae bacterium]|jgi:serine/threonine protein phosphatase PrpC|nr:SpoIIE family protein phosphatase [Clostridiaceae bacterium]